MKTKIRPKQDGWLAIMLLAGAILACKQFQPATPTYTLTSTASATPTFTLTPTPSLTPSPSNTATPLPPTYTYTPVPPTDTPIPATATPDNFSVFIRLKPVQGKLFDLLKIEAERAKKIGLKPFAEFYADWCPACMEIENSKYHTLMMEAFNGTYIIQLNVDEWNDYLAGTGFDFEYIPIFFRLDEDGKPTGDWIDGGAWAENIPENMAPPLKAFFHAED